MKAQALTINHPNNSTSPKEIAHPINVSREGDQTMKKVLLPWPTDKELAEVIEDAKTDLEALRKVAEVDTSPIPNEKEWFARARDLRKAGCLRTRRAQPC